MSLIALDPAARVRLEHQGATFVLRPPNGRDVLELMELAQERNGTHWWVGRGALAIAARGLAGWEGVVDAAGQPIPFPADGSALDRLDAPAIQAIAVRLMELTKLGEVHRKNSDAAPASGSAS